MELQTPIVAPPTANLTQAVAIPVDEVERPNPPMVQPTAEEVEAREAVFSARDQESDTVAALLGMWTGAILLKDLAVENFSKPADRVDRDEEKEKDEKKS
jgi:hypothetical protein